MRVIRFFREWLQDRNIGKAVVVEYKKELCERYVVKSINAFLVFKGWHNLKVKVCLRISQKRNMNSL